MRVRATVVIEYDLPDEESWQDAYGTTDQGEVLAKEAEFLEGDEGQGDYLQMTIGAADAVQIIEVVRDE